MFVHKPKEFRRGEFEGNDGTGTLLGYYKGDAYRALMLDSNTIKETNDVSIDGALIKTTEDVVKYI